MYINIISLHIVLNFYADETGYNFIPLSVTTFFIYCVKQILMKGPFTLGYHFNNVVNSCNKIGVFVFISVLLT
jgi:hypothetical protein